MQVYYNKDADLSLIKGKTVTIIGYGLQGHAHAVSLKDPGVRVVVGLRQGGSWEKAEAAGLEVLFMTDATKKTDVVVILLSNKNQPVVYKNEIEPNLKQGAALALTHDFNVHYNQTVPRTDLGVIMVTPKDPGHAARSEFLKDGSAPLLIAVYQGKSGKTRGIALSYAAANGGTKGGVIETNFREETGADLFGEQVVLCGGMVELIKTGFETLTKASYASEMAYFECLYEMRLIIDLICEGGVTNMNYSISNNAEYDEHATGVEVINDKLRETIRNVSKRVQTGEYAKVFIQEGAINYANMAARCRSTVDHQIEKVDAQLRSMIPWIAKDRLVDLGKN